VILEIPESEVTALYVNGEALTLSLDGGETTFTVQAEGDTLTLTGSQNDSEWTVASASFETIRNCGYENVQFNLDDSSFTINLSEEEKGKTESGSGPKKASGSTAQNTVWKISTEGVCLSVGSLNYQIVAE